MIQTLNQKYPNLPPLVTGAWNLSELQSGKLGNPKTGLKVFSCFHCGGGSTMGYKLAGFDVLGGIEIDQDMMAIYKKNHAPKYSYLMGVQEFAKIPNTELPNELFDLDVLDGSPPCSSFSMAGARERLWGKEKKFREGQAMQVLDDLFFHFIDVAVKLRPKIVVAENVKGLIAGNARGYVKEIFEAFKKAGYETQLFLLNASRMGVPQMRERTFFIAKKNPQLKFNFKFNEPIINVKQSWDDLPKQFGKPLSEFTLNLWKKTSPSKSMAEANNGNGFNNIRFPWLKPAPTIAASGGNYHPMEPRQMNGLEYFRLQSFPDDFECDDPRYICGMSVPPFMMQRVATEIAHVLLTKSLEENNSG